MSSPADEDLEVPSSKSRGRGGARIDPRQSALEQLRAARANAGVNRAEVRC